jgi:hypothetical protein
MGKVSAFLLRIMNPTLLLGAGTYFFSRKKTILLLKRCIEYLYWVDLGCYCKGTEACFPLSRRCKTIIEIPRTWEENYEGALIFRLKSYVLAKPIAEAQALVGWVSTSM